MAEEDHAGLLAYLADVGACEGGRTMREVRSASQNPDAEPGGRLRASHSVGRQERLRGGFEAKWRSGRLSRAPGAERVNTSPASAGGERSCSPRRRARY